MRLIEERIKAGLLFLESKYTIVPQITEIDSFALLLDVRVLSA